MSEKHLPHDHGTISEELHTKMPKPQTFCRVSDIFKLMSDSKRIEIFWLLCHCEECVINISALVEMSSPAVSHHLKLLKTAGLIKSRRDGKEVYYTVSDCDRAQELHKMIERTVEVACPDDEPEEEETVYGYSEKVIRDIHSMLTNDLKTRYTIDELAARFHINKTTLKSAFKTVYGAPIAAYMKEYRIKKAAEMLAKSNKAVSEIALDVGYENQSKFTSAFKEIMGILPKDHRKNQ